MNTAIPPEQHVWISHHARHRLREHFPNIGIRGSRAMLDAATPIEQGEAAGILHRPMERAADRYFLSHDRRGLFVVAESEHTREPGAIWRSMVTYIRFVPSQIEMVTRLWPADEMRGAA